MKKFLATAAFITTTAVSVLAQSEPRMMTDDEAKDRVELSARDNFFEAIDNGDGTATIVMVGKEPYWGMPGDPRSEMHILINDTNGDNEFTSEDTVTGYEIVALQKTKKNRAATAEEGTTFNKLALDKKAILDIYYHENLAAKHTKFTKDNTFLHKNYSDDQKRARGKFLKIFNSEANAMAVIEDTFGVTPGKNIETYQVPQYK